jgi:hypothetical protein
MARMAYPFSLLPRSYAGMVAASLKLARACADEKAEAAPGKCVAVNAIFTTFIGGNVKRVAVLSILRLVWVSGATLHRAGEKALDKTEHTNVEAFPEERRRRHGD